MILTDPAELAQYLPNHVLQNLDHLQGFFAISESDFLAERLGRPLLNAVQQHYNDMRPVLTIHTINMACADKPWYELILLCQPVVAFDAVSRAADIQAISVNQGGINIAETGGYDIAPDKYIANYKAQCVKEAHAASNRLLIQLEDWQRLISSAEPTPAPVPEGSPEGQDGSAPASPTAPVPDAFASAPTLSPEQLSSIRTIVTLWQQSPYYFFIEGLLFSTAQQFGAYINIYDSREKFIHLVPDIRYCQEVHLEAELGEEWLYAFIDRYHRGELSKVELKAYHMLQRTLSLYVEARAPMFSARAKQARDEATGHMALTLRYIHDHNLLSSDAGAEAPPASSTTPSTPCPMHGSPSPSSPSHTDSRCCCHSRSGFYSSSLI